MSALDGHAIFGGIIFVLVSEYMAYYLTVSFLIRLFSSTLGHLSIKSLLGAFTGRACIKNYEQYRMGGCSSRYYGNARSKAI